MGIIEKILLGPYNTIIDKGPYLIFLFIVGYVVIMIVRKVLSGTLRAAKVHKSLRQMMVSVANVLMWAIFLVMLMQAAGLGRIALAFTGSVAIIGIMMASGANTLVTDLIAGFFLAGDNDFNVGYKIKTGDIEGIVEKIDIRKIRVRDKDGLLHVLPNSMFDKAQWVVLDDNKEKR